MDKKSCARMFAGYVDSPTKPGEALHPGTVDSIYFIFAGTDLHSQEQDSGLLCKVHHVNPEYSAEIRHLLNSEKRRIGLVYIFRINTVVYNLNEIGYGTREWRYDFPEQYLRATEPSKQFIREVQRQFDKHRESMRI